MASMMKQQVERILDEGSGATQQVIARMREEMPQRDPALRAAAFRTLQRSLSLSPREFLPEATEAAAGTVEEPKRQRAERRRFRVPAELPGSTRREIRSSARRGVRSLLRADAVSRHQGSATQGALCVFEAARSVLLELPRDDLHRLPEQSPEIASVYVNRKLRVPRVVETRRLPGNVADNKVSAWGVDAIGAMSVWGAVGARGNGVTVGVLDTGVDASHPDLNGKVAHWAEFDPNGNEVAGSSPHDTHQHGTHVCGTVCGGNASGQWIGVAPRADLAVGLVLDGETGGTDAQVLAGIDWALFGAKVHVINMSLGGLTLGPDVPDTYTSAILTAIQLGVPVVTAIGNEGSQTSGTPGNDLLSFAVGASDPADRAAGFSGGRTQVIQQSSFLPPDVLPLPYSKPDVSAPGVAVRSAVPAAEWATFNGTSMATPHVAGAVALLLSATTIRGNVPAADRAFLVQDLLTSSVEELGESGQDHRFGFGRIDILRAVGFAKELGY